MELDGLVIVITGGGSGIGAATAELAVTRGAKVAIVDADSKGAATTRERLEAIAPGAVMARTSDVSDPAAIAADVAAITGAWGRIDALVTAAGIFSLGSVIDVDETGWRRVMDVNLDGTWRWCRAAIAQMRPRGAGCVVTVASQQALAGGRANAAYLASKGAVMSLTRTMALDFVKDGIRVNCVVPGAIETPMLRGSLAGRNDPQKVEQASLARNPMGRFGSPFEVAEGILFLAGPRSGFVTGTNLCVDGGWLAA